MEINHDPFSWAYPLYDELIEQMANEYEQKIKDAKQT